MLPYLLTAISLVCVCIILIMYLQVRSYLKTHGDEELSVAQKFLNPRIHAMEISVVVAAIASVLRVILF